MTGGILRPGKFGASGARLAAGVAGRGVAEAAASALDEPLLAKVAGKQSRTTDSVSSDDEDEERGMGGKGRGRREDDDDDETTVSSGGLLPESMSGREALGAAAVSILVVGAMASAASAMIAVPTAIVFVMGGVSILNCPTVAHKHLGIVKNGNRRTIINNLRKEADILKHEVDFVSRSVDDLQAEADTLVGLERQLSTIARKQGMTASKLVDLVNENEEIGEMKKRNLRLLFGATMAKVLIRVDSDGSMTIDKKEAPHLAISLQVELDAYGLKLDTRKFGEMLSEDNSVMSVLKFCHDLMLESEAPEDSDTSSVDSELTFDFEAFCKSLANDEGNSERRMTFAEKVDMVTIDERYSKGSVEVARGKRMTLMSSHSTKGERRRTIVKEVKRRQTRMSHQRATLAQGRGRRDDFKRQSHLRRQSQISFASGMLVVKKGRGGLARQSHLKL